MAKSFVVNLGGEERELHYGLVERAKIERAARTYGVEKPAILALLGEDCIDIYALLVWGGICQSNPKLRWETVLEWMETYRQEHDGDLSGLLETVYEALAESGVVGLKKVDGKKEGKGGAGEKPAAVKPEG